MKKQPKTQKPATNVVVKKPKEMKGMTPDRAKRQNKAGCCKTK